MSTDKVLSIIVPSYNMEQYLTKCLDSLIISSIDLIDVIIVNDGSKDSTTEIAHKYSDKYPDTFRVIDKQNGNYGSCINAGIKEARGKYVKILDADDYFDTSNFNDFVVRLSEIDCDLVVSDYDMVDSTDCVSFSWKLKEGIDGKTYTNDVLFSMLCSGTFQMHAVTYKVSNIRKLNYQQLEGISYTDQQWMFVPMSVVNTMYYFNKVVYKYLVGREGQTVSSDAYARNSGAVMTISNKMVNDYRLLNTNNPYLSFRMIRQLELLYYVFLIKKSDNEAIAGLRQFDDRLKDVLPDFYERLNDTILLGYPFRYINYWRRKKRIGNSLVFKAIRKALKIRKKYIR